MRVTGTATVTATRTSQPQDTDNRTWSFGPGPVVHFRWYSRAFVTQESVKFLTLRGLRLAQTGDTAP